MLNLINKFETNSDDDDDDNDDDVDESFPDLIDRSDRVDDRYQFIKPLPFDNVQDITPTTPITRPQMNIFVDERIEKISIKSSTKIMIQL